MIITPHSLCWTDQLSSGCAKAAVASVLTTLSEREPQGLVNREILQNATWRLKLDRFAVHEPRTVLTNRCRQRLIDLKMKTSEHPTDQHRGAPGFQGLGAAAVVAGPLALRSDCRQLQQTKSSKCLCPGRDMIFRDRWRNGKRRTPLRSSRPIWVRMMTSRPKSSAGGGAGPRSHHLWLIVQAAICSIEDTAANR